ncbi:MAG: cytochrome b N-terminal domain-containing protein, partial [Pirellulaceae bacterium]
MKWLVNWVDDRTGVKELVHESLYENIPGGAKWRYVSGSMLVFAFVTQVITGMFLWMFYSAGSQNAWASVYHIQNVVPGGWVLRGIHHFMAQAMVVLLPVHMLQVIWEKAYQKPREINYWLGLILLLITMGLGLTGYLLPWDQ